MPLNYKLTSNITNFLLAIIMACVIGILCTIGMKSKNGVEALIAEYSVMAGAIILLTLMIFLNLRDNSAQTSFKSFLVLFPFFILLFIIFYFITLLSTYFEVISANNVSEYYTSFSNTSAVLILIQLYVLVSSLLKNPMALNIDEKTFSTLMFLGVLNLIVVITVGVVLKFYTTDC
jgi:putative Mn2+ efflux pump MntP